MSSSKRGEKDTNDDAEEEEEEEEEDLEKLQAEIARMEAEAAQISRETLELEEKKDRSSGADGASTGAAAAAGAEKPAKDSCSIYVGQVDYSATPEELVSHFGACGTIERVTIVCDKYTGKPKGFAYLEFQEESSVENAVKLDGSEFKGRTLKITPKRVNVPGFHGGGRGRGRGGRVPPGRGFRGRGGRGYRGGFRGGGRGGYHPYY